MALTGTCEFLLTLETLRSKFEFSFVAPIHVLRSSGEKFIKC